MKNISNILSTLKGECINIGCGKDIRAGWKNLDKFPLSEDVGHFDILNNSDLDWLSMRSAALIESNHVIGYLTLKQATNFFKAAKAGLKPGGIFILEFPDFAKICKMFSDYQQSKLKVSSEYDYIEIIRSIYAYDQEDAYKDEFNLETYKMAWSADFLSSKLLEIGFFKVNISQPKTHSRRTYRDSRIEAFI